MKFTDSIQASYEKQAREQGRPIYSSEDRFYLAHFEWEDTVEGDLFWAILYYSYALYRVYDYETLIKIYIRFNTVPNYNTVIYFIYRDYFDEVNGTLTDEGLENLIKQIEKC